MSETTQQHREDAEDFASMWVRGERKTVTEWLADAFAWRDARNALSPSTEWDSDPILRKAQAIVTIANAYQDAGEHDLVKVPMHELRAAAAVINGLALAKWPPFRSEWDSEGVIQADRNAAERFLSPTAALTTGPAKGEG